MGLQSTEKSYQTFEYFRKDRTVALRITQDMFSRLLHRAQQEQVPYQRMIRNIMEEYLNDTIVVLPSTQITGAAKERKSTTVTFRASDQLLNAVTDKGGKDHLSAPAIIRKSLEAYLMKEPKI